jgi:DNA helicase-2/ATP-dependent DNA helicase PcrA
VPAYVVFTDLTLIALAEALPTTDSELLAVSGVGLTKLERYGADVMAICAVAPSTHDAAGDPSGDPVGNG